MANEDTALRHDAVYGRLRESLLVFLEAMKALRDLNAFALAHEDSIEGENAVDRFYRERVMPLSAERKRRVMPSLTRWTLAVVRGRVPEERVRKLERILQEQSGRESEESFDPTTKEDVHDDPAHDVPAESPSESPKSPADRSSELSAAFHDVISALEDPHAAGDFMRTVTEGVHVERAGLLRSSLITSAVTAIEVLLATVATQFYRLHNDALAARKVREGTSDKEFSFEELKSYGNIQEAIDALIERRVDALLREGIDEWVRWFERNTGVKLPDLALDWAATIEVFQRRHLFVHTAGQVTSQYLRVTGAGIKQGTTLTADAKYVSRACDLLTVVGVAVVAHTAAKLMKDRAGDVTNDVSAFVYRQLMLNNFWSCVEPICRGTISLCAEDVTRQILRVNSWLGRKRVAGNIDEIRSEVQSWDTTALSPRYRVAKLALLDDFEALLPALKHAVDRGDVDDEELRTWPLLAEVRAQPTFKDFFPDAGTKAASEVRNTDTRLN